MLDGASSVDDPEAGEESLWLALREAGSPAARERLFTAYLPFARALAGRRFKGRGGADLEYNDLLQLACAGLLEAIDRFDSGLGVPFKGFAVRRINGSMVDGIAKMSEVREQISFRNRVQRERLRSLSPDGAGPVPRSRAMEALVDMAVGLALGFMLEGTTLYHKESDPSVTATAYDSAAWKELVERAATEVARLPERDRRIIELHYLEEVNFDHIAALFGLTKGRISQLHKAAMLLLRKRLSAVAGFRLER
jgi:RNA polymerase sigma factor for flagellar operon FliA